MTNILTLLPGIAPTARTFQLDEYPQQKAKSRNGRSVRWAQATTGVNARLELEWEALTNAEAEMLLRVWDDSYGLYGALDLAGETLRGLSPDLVTLLRTPSAGVEWRFEEPPEMELIKAGRCTVRMKLVSRKKVALVLPAAVSFTLDSNIPECANANLCETLVYTGALGPGTVLTAPALFAGALSYQWYITDLGIKTALTGETSSTYTVSSLDAGSSLSVIADIPGEEGLTESCPLLIPRKGSLYCGTQQYTELKVRTEWTNRLTYAACNDGAIDYDQVYTPKVVDTTIQVGSNQVFTCFRLMWKPFAGDVNVYEDHNPYPSQVAARCARGFTAQHRANASIWANFTSTIDGLVTWWKAPTGVHVPGGYPADPGGGNSNIFDSQFGIGSAVMRVISVTDLTSNTDVTNDFTANDVYPGDSEFYRSEVDLWNDALTGSGWTTPLPARPVAT